MGRYSPTQKPGTLLASQAIVVSGGVGAVTNGTAFAPTGSTRWFITGFSADAPAGSDGAIFWYKGSVAAANLMFVTPIGEKTSDTIAVPFALDSAGSNLLPSVTGVPNGTVTVNILGNTG